MSKIYERTDFLDYLGSSSLQEYITERTSWTIREALVLYTFFMSRLWLGPSWLAADTERELRAALQRGGGKLFSDELFCMYHDKPWLKTCVGSLRIYATSSSVFSYHSRTDSERPYITLTGEESDTDLVSEESGFETGGAAGGPGRGERDLFRRYLQKTPMPHNANRKWQASTRVASDAPAGVSSSAKNERNTDRPTTQCVAKTICSLKLEEKPVAISIWAANQLFPDSRNTTCLTRYMAKKTLMPCRKVFRPASRFVTTLNVTECITNTGGRSGNRFFVQEVSPCVSFAKSAVLQGTSWLTQTTL